MPDGRSIRSPWFAMMMTVPLRETSLPNVTSPDTVKWSNSKISGTVANLVRNWWTCEKQEFSLKIHFIFNSQGWCNNNRRKLIFFYYSIKLTLEKWLSPNLINGVVGNIRLALITKEPLLNVYKLLITKNRSEVFFTGKNLLRGTRIPKKSMQMFTCEFEDFSKHPVAILDSPFSIL